jgi:DNA topoisomerase-1
VPEDRGRLVTSFLTNFFRRYVEYNFTAELEQKLDLVSDGKLDWKVLLRDFWSPFVETVDETKNLKFSEVISALDQDLSPHLFPQEGDGHDPRACPACSNGRLSLKLGKFGAFVGCSNYPACQYTRPLVVANGDQAKQDGEAIGPQLLGVDSETGLPITLRRGPYGTYLQLGPAVTAAPAPESEAEPEAPKGKGKAKAKPVKEKPKRVSLPKGMQPADVDLTTALRLLSLPRDIGVHPDKGEMITAGIGRFGPYLKLGPRYKNLGQEEDVLTIGLNRAVDLLADDGGAAGGARGLLRAMGEHPADKKPITLNKGRFGPYVRHGSVMASLSKKQSPDDLTLEQAIELLTAKAAAGPAKGGKFGKAKPAAKPTKAKAAPKRKSATA